METFLHFSRLSEKVRYQFDDEQYKTVTSKEQIETERLIEKCYYRFEQLICLDPTLPKLFTNQHIHYLESSLRNLSTSYECLDSSRPWLVYWILNAAVLINYTFDEKTLDNVVDFLTKCRSPIGGFGGGPGQYPHLAPTYAAVNSLIIIGTEKSYKAIDKKSLKEFLWAVREPNGAFRMHIDGEIDVRGAYCAISSSKLACFSEEDEKKLFENTVEWIVSCQTYEGGFGGTPDLEAHGGYSFCSASALALLGRTGTCDLIALLRWTLNRQMKYEGGFQGRTNKLVDGCYSFWQGALVPIIQALIAGHYNDSDLKAAIHSPLFNREALQRYILICCQKTNGGLIDKPGKHADLYHTCYVLSGLSVSQHCDMNEPSLIIGCPDNELLPTHPLHNVPPKSVLKAFRFYQEIELDKIKNDKVNIDTRRDSDTIDDDEISDLSNITSSKSKESSIE